MELIRDLIEWFANNFGEVLATTFPFLLVGLLGLYMLWLLVGYLRVTQVGVEEGRGSREAVALLPGSTAAEPAPGLPYCPVDSLQYPPGARFCTRCERDLNIDCRTCGTTITAADDACYRCGTPTGATDPARLG